MEIPADMQKVLRPNETVVLFVDSRTHHETTIDSLLLTNERIIIGRENPQTDKTDLTSHAYADVTGVGLEKGFMRSIIRLRLKAGGTSMDSIRLPPKVDEQVLGILKDKVCGRPGPC